MGTAVRHYLFPDEGEPRRLSQRLVNGLIHGDDAVVEYANTRQRVLSVYIETEESRLIEIYRVEGSIWSFDEDGCIRGGLQDALAAFMDVVPQPRSGSKVS
jgi:hypothetical protein